MNFLVETKNEYTIQLVNILTPHIFEGFESIYLESRKIIKKGEENKLLKAFQQFIKRIPSWNANLVETETKRIETASQCDFIYNLLKAVIKANIILLTNNSIKKEDIDEKYLDITLSKFIHKCYIESARQFYTSPYLFYHEVKPIDKKRNQRDSNEIIKSSIKEAIRKMLPVQHILNKYLGEDIKIGSQEVDKPISNIDSDNLRQMVNKELDLKLNEKERIKTSSINNDIPLNLNYEDGKSNFNNLTADESNKIMEIQNISLNPSVNEVSKELMFSDKKLQNETDTLRLLSDVRKNIDSEQVKSIPITNYYSDNIEKLGIEMKDSERKQEKLQEERKSIIENSLDLNNNNVTKSEVVTNNLLNNNDQNNDVNNDRNDTESSIPYLKKDEEYEDVFSNINDTVSSELFSDRNKKNGEKKKDIYFNSFNMI